jgi:hypothetical protein
MFGRRKVAERRRSEREEARLAQRARVLAEEASAVAQVEEIDATLPPFVLCARGHKFRPKGWGRMSGVAQPLPQPGSCPECVEEMDKLREAQREHVDVEHPAYSEKRFPPQQRSLVDQAWKRYEERMIESGQPLPGSPEEARAIERMDELREKNPSYKKHSPGRHVFSVIENHVEVDYYEVRPDGLHSRPRLVRVAPQ